VWARPLDRRLGCRVTKPGRAEDRRSGLSPQVLSVRRAGQAAIRSVARTSSGSKTSSVKTPRSSGFWLMRNWRKSRSRRSRMETSRPRNAGGQPFVTCSACWGSASSSPARHWATSSHPTLRACHGHPARSGCDVAVLAAPLRQRPSTTGVSARVSQRPRRRLGSQSRENTMPLARRRASSATAPPAQRPRQLHRTTDRNLGCTQSGVGGGPPVRRHHRRVADQDRLDRR
jgi:hypothetical protein